MYNCCNIRSVNNEMFRLKINHAQEEQATCVQFLGSILVVAQQLLSKPIYLINDAKLVYFLKNNFAHLLILLELLCCWGTLTSLSSYISALNSGPTFLSSNVSCYCPTSLWSSLAPTMRWSYFALVLPCSDPALLWSYLALMLFCSCPTLLWSYLAQGQSYFGPTLALALPCSGPILLCFYLALILACFSYIALVLPCFDPNLLLVLPCSCPIP